MSLLTVERNSPSPQESDAEETLSSSSHEGFVAREHYVTSLPPRPWASLGRHGGEQLRIFTHLKKVIKLLRNSDTIKLAVELENAWPRKVTKHLVLVATNGYQDTEEAIVLGTEQEDSVIRLGLVLPLWRDTEIKLDGDGGFIVHSGDRQAVFKPSSVQSMWTTLQSLYQSTENARINNYYVGGLSHTWMSYYQAQLTDDYIIRNEWNLMKDVKSFRPDSPIYSSHITSTTTDNVFEKQLVSRLRGVMLHEDLEEVTSRQLRQKLEKEMDMQLNEYREFLDRHMLMILGQMEQPSKILEYLYLGSEWNASNLSELKDLGIGYILNVTREIDNFYPEVFKYLNIRLYDVPDSELIKHWEKTYKFIKEAKMMDTKVLVHCKMGISRSAATVIAYMMKEYQMPLADAKKHVKSIRGCINPNDGFMGQLRSYEGILTARHNPRWGRHAPTRLYSKRSMSDPDIMQSLEKVEIEKLGMVRRGEGEKEGGEWEEGDREESQFRPIHNVLSAYNIPNLLHQTEEPELTFLPEEEVITTRHMDTDPQSNATPVEKVTRVQSTPVDKTRNLQHFLASLPPPPVVVGNTDDGIGENIPTSNSGSAYSSPMYTPPDDENIHLHMAQNRERVRQDEVCEGVFSSDAGIASADVHVVRSCGESGMVAKHQVKPETSPNEGSMVHQPSPKSSPPPLQHSLVRQQQIQLEEVGTVGGGVINFPVTNSHRSNSLPYALSEFIAHGNGSITAKKPCSVSPTTSQYSMARRSPAVPESEEEGGSSEKHQGSSPNISLQETNSIETQVHSDSPTENMTPRTREKFMHHRRTKSDSHHDTSGPIKTAQIFSVPERVKEIEEKASFQVSQLLQAVNQTDSQSCPSDGHHSVTSSTSRTSSEECLAPSFVGTTTDDRDSSVVTRAPNSNMTSDSITTTRHTSLSPKPSSTAATTGSAHLPVQTSISLPTNISSPDLTCPDPSQDDLVSSLHGVVKAKIQDIEGKKSTQSTGEKTRGATQSDIRGNPYDTVTKRTSAATIQRPKSEIIFHSPYVGMVEMSDPPSDSESPTSKTDVNDRGSSLGPSSLSKGFENSTIQHHVGRRNTTCDVFSSSKSKDDSRIHSGAVFNAWVGILPTEDLQADDLASVLELRQKFERNNEHHRKLEQQSSLRRSRSLRDTRLLSPPVRLGGSTRWKKYSSNANLGDRRHQRSCASASPTHGSQQSLSSSVKI